jgi:hypothetical protein
MLPACTRSRFSRIQSLNEVLGKWKLQKGMIIQNYLALITVMHLNNNFTAFRPFQHYLNTVVHIALEILEARIK